MKYIEIDSVRSPEAVASLQAAVLCLHTASQCEGLESALDNGVLPSAFVKAMNGWWEAYERFLAIVHEHEQFACQAGCWSCCVDNPRGNTGVELLWLYMGIRQRADYFKLAQAVVGAATAFEKVFQENQKDLESSQMQWKRQRKRCVFLQDDNRCGVYQYRPIACRMFVSVTEPAWCDPEHERASEAINPHLEPPMVMRKILLHISQRLGLDAMPSDLFRGMAWMMGYILRHASLEIE